MGMCSMQVCAVSQDWRRCYKCKQHGHIAKYCPSVRQTVHPPGQPSEKSTKSAKRIERDNARMSAYNARKASMANMPFASVSTEEFKTLLPRPDHNRDSAFHKDTIQKYKTEIQELKSKLNDRERELEMNCLAIDVKDLQSENDELRERIVSKKSEKREYVQKVRKELDTKDTEIVQLKIQILNANHKLSWTEKCNADLCDKVEQDEIRIYELEKQVRNSTGQGQSRIVHEGQGHRVHAGQGQHHVHAVRNEQMPGLFMARRPPRQGYRQRGNRYPKQ